MKLGFPFAGLFALCFALPATAGSFLVASSPTQAEGPSFVHIGKNAAQEPVLTGPIAHEMRRISPSVAEFGEPPAKREDAGRRRDPHLPVLVMRAGEVGGGTTSPPAAQQNSSSATQSAQPAAHAGNSASGEGGGMTAHGEPDRASSPAATTHIE